MAVLTITTPIVLTQYADGTLTAEQYNPDKVRIARLYNLASELLDKYQLLAENVITEGIAIYAPEDRERLAAIVAEYRRAINTA